MVVTTFQRFLDISPRGRDGALLISPHRKYQHDENLYDEQYQISAHDYLAGQGLKALVDELSINIDHPILELGCGSGRLSVGILKSFDPLKVLVTDASSIFLDIARKKFVSNGLKVPHLGLLRFEDIHLLPQATFSLVVLRSALHHVNRYGDFIAAASRTLVPGGALIFQEPLYEGLFLLGLIGKFLQAHAQDEQVRADISLLSDVMAFYCRTDIDKSASEDKFVFKLHDILEAANLAGLQTKYYPNKSLESFVTLPTKFDYSEFVTSYLKYCMSFGEKTVAFFESTAKDALEYISMTSGTDRAPESSGVFVLIRPLQDKN
jgi:ubiquinone/menaquinone biosynthesis C-methylase UbiE